MDINSFKPLIEDLFQGKSTVSKQEVVQKGQQHGLPSDQLQQLPDKQFSKDELMHHLSGLGGLGGGLSDLEKKIA